MSSCRIRRNKDTKQVEGVYTKSGARSQLFDALAGIPLVQNIEDAVRAFKSVHSDAYKKSHGDWEKVAPLTKDARRIREELRKKGYSEADAIARQASEMENPVLLHEVEPGDIETSMKSYAYGAETSSSVFLAEKANGRKYDLSDQSLTDLEKEEFKKALDNGSEIWIDLIKEDGTEVILVDGSYIMKNIASIKDDTAEKDTRLFYESGEPKVFFKDGKEVFHNNYKDALTNTVNGNIEVAVLHGSISNDSPSAKEADIVFSEDGTAVVKNEKAFTTLFSISSYSGTETVEGNINRLIRKGYLSDVKERAEDGSYRLSGQGNSDVMKMGNAVYSMEELKMEYGRSVSLDENGLIKLDVEGDDITVTDIEGNTEKVNLGDLADTLEEEGFPYLEEKYGPAAPAMFLHLLNVNGLLFEEEGEITEADREDEANNYQRLTDFLESIGIESTSLLDYMEQYRLLNGHMPSSVELFDAVKGLMDYVALRNDSLSIESSRLAVSQFVNSDMLNEAAAEIESSEEWREVSEQDYAKIENVIDDVSEKADFVRRDALSLMVSRDSESTEEKSGRVTENILTEVVSEISSRTDENTENDLASIENDITKSEAKQPRMTYFSASGRRTAERIESASQKLEQKMSNFIKGMSDTAHFRGTRQKLRGEIEELKKIDPEELERNYGSKVAENAINTAIMMAESEADYLTSKVASMANMNSGKLKCAHDMKAHAEMSKEMESMLGSIDDILRQVENGTDEIPKSEIDSFRRRIKQTNEKLSSASSSIMATITEDSDVRLEAIMDKYGVQEQHKPLVRAELKKDQSDISIFTRWLGLLRDASSYILKLLGQIISANNMNARIGAIHDMADFLHDIRVGGWTTAKFEALCQRDSDGNVSSFLKNEIRLADYYKAMRAAQIDALMESLKDLNKDEYDEYQRDKAAFVDKATRKGLRLRIGADSVFSGEYESNKTVQGYIGNTLVELAKPKMKDAFYTFRPSNSDIDVSMLDVETARGFKDRMNEWHEANDERYYKDEYYDEKKSIERRASHLLPIHVVMDEYGQMPGNEDIWAAYNEDFDAFVADLVNKGHGLSMVINGRTEQVLRHRVLPSGEVVFELDDNMLHPDILKHLNGKMAQYDTAIQESIEIMAQRRRNRRLSRRSFYNSNGTFDYKSYVKSSEYASFQGQEKAYKERKLVQNVTTGAFKQGREAITARLLNQMQNDWNGYYNQLRQNVNQTKFSQEFIDAVLDNPSLTQQEKFDIITNGGNIYFNDSFWDQFESVYKSMADEILNQKYGRFRTAAITLQTRKAIEGLEKNNKRIRNILSLNRKKGQPGEINDNISDEHMRLIREIEAENKSLRTDIQTAYNLMEELATNYGYTFGQNLDFDFVGETSFNDFFLNSITDKYGVKSIDDLSVEQILEFLKNEKVMDRSSYDKVESLMGKLMGFGKGVWSKKFSDAEIKTIAKILNIKNPGAANSASILQAVKAAQQQYQDTLKKILIEHASSRVHSYYRKTAPKGYNEWLNNIKNNTWNGNFRQLLEDKMVGRNSGTISDELFGYMDITGADDWYDGDSLMEQLRNKNYQEDSDYGIYQPKKSLYTDSSYATYFGMHNGVATKNVSEWNMINTLKEKMRTISEKYDKKGEINLYMKPQISKQGLERWAKVSSDPMTMLQNAIADNIMNRVDDPLYGQTAGGNIDNTGSDNFVVPRYFIEPLENEEDVSNDFGFSYAVMDLMANEYKYKTESLDDIFALKNKMLSQQMKGRGLMENSNIADMFNDFANYHLYNVKMISRKYVDILGYRIDVTKIMSLLLRMAEWSNLAFSPFVGIKGITSNFMNQSFENVVGQYLSKESTAYAIEYCAKNGLDYIKEIGDIDRSNPMYILGETFGIFSLKERVHSAGYNKLFRVFKNMGYKLGEIGETALNPIMMISVLDNMRLVEIKTANGSVKQFVSKNEYNNLKRKNLLATTEEWSALRGSNLLSMLDITADGVKTKAGLSADVAEAVRKGKIVANTSIRFISETANGVLRDENQIAARRHYVLQYFMSHRGWLIMASARLFKKKGLNFDTQQMEEGYLRSYFSVIRRSAEALSKGGLSMLKDVYEGKTGNEDIDFSDVERFAMKHLMVEAAFVGMFAAMALALKGWDDDDDDENSDISRWMKEMAIYSFEGTQNEWLSQTSAISFFQNTFEAMESPIAVSRYVSNFSKKDAWTTQRVTSGIYKGDTKIYKTLVSSTPLRHYHTLHNGKNVRRTRRSWELYNRDSTWFLVEGEKTLEARRKRNKSAQKAKKS